MKTLIVYYSYTGTTEKYVKRIKEVLSADSLELKPKQDIKSKGFASYIVGGIKSMKKEAPNLQEYSFNKDNYDFIIFASPVWAYTYAPAMRTFFETEKIEDKTVSYFYTHKGGPGKTKTKFEEALKNNKILEGLDINAKNDENESMKKVESWAQDLKILINK